VCGAEKAHRVVLLGGDPVALEELVFEKAEAVVSSPEVEVDLLLRAIEAGVLGVMFFGVRLLPFSRRNHGSRVIVGGIVVETKVGWSSPSETPGRRRR